MTSNRVLVDHTYTDFSIIRPEELSAALKTKGYEDEVNKTFCFHFRLYKMLENSDFEDIVCWVSHGRSWMIKDKKKLEGHLPEFFKTANFRSFSRQVIGWGFKVSWLTCFQSIS